IKVLKDMPTAELVPAMKYMSAALGVSCDFCHVTKNGELDFGADNKEEKKTAREMIKMVRNINQRDFGGELQVSCYTCHAGQPIPQKFPALPVAMVTAKPPPAPTPPLPDASTLLDKHIAAIGGQSALDGIKSCSVKGNFTTGNGATGTYESEQILPDRAYESLTTSRGVRERGTHDGSGWEKIASKVSDLLAGQAIDTQLS